jgi:hypothetical protein
MRSFRHALEVPFPCTRLLALTIAAASPASALTIVHLEPAASVVTVGDTVTVAVVADFTEPIVAFGLDLDITPALLGADSSPVVGAAWIGVAAPDGDGLAGLTSTSGIVGTGVLLATVELTALGAGTAVLVGSITPGDLTEGFGLSTPGSFDGVQFEPGEITVVPEPSTIMLVGTALLSLGRARRTRRA